MPRNSKLVMVVDPKLYVVNELRNKAIDVAIVDNQDARHPRRVIRICHIFKRRKKKLLNTSASNM